MDGNVLMEKVLAVENRPVLLAGIALGGIAAAIFMKRLGPMRVLGIAPLCPPSPAVVFGTTCSPRLERRCRARWCGTTYPNEPSACAPQHSSTAGATNARGQAHPLHGSHHKARRASAESWPCSSHHVVCMCVCVLCVVYVVGRDGDALGVRSTTNSGSGGSAVYESARAVDEYLQVCLHVRAQSRALSGAQNEASSDTVFYKKSVFGLFSERSLLES